MKKQLSVHTIVLSLLGFVFLWTVLTDAWGYSARFLPFDDSSYLYAYLSRLVWAAPAMALIIRYSGSLKISKRELFSQPHFDRPLVLALVLSAVYVVTAMVLTHNGFWFNSQVNPLLEVVKFAVVGFVEEMVFRGWGYNALARVLSDRKAMMISTALFVLLHWPAYFVKLYRFGTFDFAALLTQSLSALLWGIVLCWLLRKGKSLWSPIIAHGLYDLMVVLLIG